MYTTYRSFFRYGNESDYVDITVKEFPTIEKAISYAHRYAKGIRFCSVEVEDEIGCNGVIRHVVELLMLAAAISMFTFAQLMDKGIVSFNIAMLLVVVLGTFIIGLIKIKIKKENKK